MTELFAQPLRLSSGELLPNRLAKAAMSESLADLKTGEPTEGLIRLYERWSRSGAGLLITGNVMVDRSALGEPGNVSIEDERHLPALRRWAETAQQHGAHLWMQINHPGRQAPRSLTKTPVAPSAVPLRGMFGMFAAPRALLPGEISAIIERFAVAAAVARKAGFSGVQLHAAHGYLISQFLSPLTNLRDDDWGGDAARRRRFLVEIVRAVRAATDRSFTLSVKLNSADFQRGGFEIEEAIEVARVLHTEGVDLIEVSGGTYERPAMTGTTGPQRESTRAREAYFLDYAQKLRGANPGPLMLTGGFRTAAAMSSAIAGGAVDVIGLARPLACEPDLPRRLLDGSALGAAPISVASRIRKINEFAPTIWHQQQLLRLAAGKEPDRTLSLWRALYLMIRRMLKSG